MHPIIRFIEINEHNIRMVMRKTGAVTALDWQCRKDYLEATKGLDMDAWRWEYLRRTPEYQKAWDRARGNISAGQFDLAILLDPNLSAMQLSAPVKFLRADEGAQLLDIKCSIPDRSIDEHFFVQYMRSILRDKEKAVYVIDIKKNIPTQITRVSESAIELQTAYKKSIETQLAKNGKRMPRRGVRTDIPEIITNNVTPKIEHLMVLDARLKKVPFSKIGQVVFNVKDADDAGTRASREYHYALAFWKFL